MNGTLGKTIEGDIAGAGRGRPTTVAMAIKEGSVEHGDRIGKGQLLVDGSPSSVRTAPWRAGQPCVPAPAFHRSLSATSCGSTGASPGAPASTMPPASQNSSVINSALLEAIHEVINGDSAAAKVKMDGGVKGRNVGKHKVVPVKNTPVLVRMLPPNNKVLVKPSDGAPMCSSVSRNNAVVGKVIYKSDLLNNNQYLQRKLGALNGHLASSLAFGSSVSAKEGHGGSDTHCTKDEIVARYKRIVSNASLKWNTPLLQRSHLLVDASPSKNSTATLNNRTLVGGEEKAAVSLSQATYNVTYTCTTGAVSPKDIPLLQREDLAIGNLSTSTCDVQPYIKREVGDKKYGLSYRRPVGTASKSGNDDVPLLQRSDLMIGGAVSQKPVMNTFSRNVEDLPTLVNSGGKYQASVHPSISEDSTTVLQRARPPSNGLPTYQVLGKKHSSPLTRALNEDNAASDKVAVPQSSSAALQRKYKLYSDFLKCQPVVATYTRKSSGNPHPSNLTANEENSTAQCKTTDLGLMSQRRVSLLKKNVCDDVGKDSSSWQHAGTCGTRTMVVSNEGSFSISRSAIANNGELHSGAHHTAGKESDPALRYVGQACKATALSRPVCSEEPEAVDKVGTGVAVCGDLTSHTEATDLLGTVRSRYVHIVKGGLPVRNGLVPKLVAPVKEKEELKQVTSVPILNACGETSTSSYWRSLESRSSSNSCASKKTFNKNEFKEGADAFECLTRQGRVAADQMTTESAAHEVPELLRTGDIAQRDQRDSSELDGGTGPEPVVQTATPAVILKVEQDECGLVTAGSSVEWESRAWGSDPAGNTRAVPEQSLVFGRTIKQEYVAAEERTGSLTEPEGRHEEKDHDVVDGSSTNQCLAGGMEERLIADNGGGGLADRSDVQQVYGDGSYTGPVVNPDTWRLKVEIVENEKTYELIPDHVDCKEEKAEEDVDGCPADEDGGIASQLPSPGERAASSSAAWVDELGRAEHSAGTTTCRQGEDAVPVSAAGSSPEPVCKVVVSVRARSPVPFHQHQPISLDQVIDIKISPATRPEDAAGPAGNQTSTAHDARTSGPLPGGSSESRSTPEVGEGTWNKRRKPSVSISALAKPRPLVGSLGSDVAPRSSTVVPRPRVIGGLYADVIRNTNTMPEATSNQKADDGHSKTTSWNTKHLRVSSGGVDRRGPTTFQTFSQFRTQQLSTQAGARHLITSTADTGLVPLAEEPKPETDVGWRSSSSDGERLCQRERSTSTSKATENVWTHIAAACSGDVKKARPWDDLSWSDGQTKRRRCFDRPAGPYDAPSRTMLDLIYRNPPTKPVREKKAARLVEPMIFMDDEWEPSSSHASADQVPAPQVMLGKDGELVIDEKSLVLDVEEVAWQRARQARAKAEDSLSGALAPPQRRHRSKKWKDKETLKFYRALNAVGTDFSTMETLFLDRTRKELKQKFMREDRLNRELIDRTLQRPGVVSTKVLEQELEQEKLEKQREEQEAVEKARRRQERKQRKLTEKQLEMLDKRHKRIICNTIIYRSGSGPRRAGYRRTAPRPRSRSPVPRPQSPRRVLPPRRPQPPRKAAAQQRRRAAVARAGHRRRGRKRKQPVPDLEQLAVGDDLCRLLEASISSEMAADPAPLHPSRSSPPPLPHGVVAPGSLLVLSAPSATGRTYKVFMVNNGPAPSPPES